MDATGPERMRQSVVCEMPEGPVLYCKGAPESVLKLCDSMLADEQVGSLDAASRARQVVVAANSLRRRNADAGGAAEIDRPKNTPQPSHPIHLMGRRFCAVGRGAQQRVACFLLEMSERLAESDVIELPMSRQDIANYLAFTIETVSRTMTQLVSDHTIGLPSSRRIVLRNHRVLRELNS